MIDIKEIWDFFSNHLATKGIIENFFAELLPIQSTLKQKEERAVVDNIHQFFKKWYYSSCIEGTVITPANIVNTMVERNYKNSMMLVPSILPAFTGRKFKNYSQFLGIANTNMHYVIEDIELLLSVSEPHIDVDEDLLLTEKARLKLKKDIFMFDKFYINFITEVAWELGLLEKMPAIGIIVAKPSNKVLPFIIMKNEEKLQKIIDAAISLCSRKLSEMTPLPHNPFSVVKIRSMLTNPVLNDDIFRNVFSPMGIDAREIMSKAAEEARDEYEEELLMGIFSLGVMLDMHFFTPFGFYLQLIQPLSALPFNFEAEIDDLLKCCKEGADFEVSLFSAFAEYDLTPLGEKMLVKGKKPVRNQRLPKKIDEEELYFAAISSSIMRLPEDDSMMADNLIDINEVKKNRRVAKQKNAQGDLTTKEDLD